ncbi:ParA family protein [Magnetospira thiophila]
MFVVAVANTKGGVGKSTLATHIAAHFARCGRATVLADLDRQKSSLAWLKRRPKDLPQITGINLSKGEAKIPKGVERLVVDAGAAMRGQTVKDLVQQADLVVIPTLASAFDEDGILRFLKHLDKVKAVRKHKRRVAFVANRVRLNSRALDHLEGFLKSQEFPLVTHLRDTQLYVNAAQDGLSIFEMQSPRVQAYVDEWIPLIQLMAESAGRK